MDQLFDLVQGVQVEPIAFLDIALTAVLVYGVLSLIQGTRAVRLIVGAILLYLLYLLAQVLDLRLLSGIMQIGAVVGLFALVVVFQPELRRGLDRLGRMGSLRWLGPADAEVYQRIATVLAGSAAALAARRTGALIVIERDTGLGDMAESGIRLDARLSTELLTSLFAPGSALHDGAVIVRGVTVAAAGVMLPLAEGLASEQRYGSRHRAALGITEQTDALALVVSEESGAISLAAGGTIARDLGDEDLRRRLVLLLRPADVPGRARSMARAGGSTLRGKRRRGVLTSRGRMALSGSRTSAALSPPEVAASVGVDPAASTPGAAGGAK